MGFPPDRSTCYPGEPNGDPRFWQEEPERAARQTTCVQAANPSNGRNSIPIDRYRTPGPGVSQGRPPAAPELPHVQRDGAGLGRTAGPAAPLFDDRQRDVDRHDLARDRIGTDEGLCGLTVPEHDGEEAIDRSKKRWAHDSAFEGLFHRRRPRLCASAVQRRLLERELQVEAALR